MKLIRFSILAATAGILAAVTASSALAPTPILVSGKYAGQASTQGQWQHCDDCRDRRGHGTMIGAGKITGTGSGD